MARAWHKAWRLNFLVIFSLLLGLVGAFGGPAAAADNGIVVSNGISLSNRPYVGANSDGSKVCVIWSVFDASPAHAFIRVLSTATQTWQPPLASAPYEVSKGSGSSTQGGSPHCAFDSNGRLHAIWAEGSSKFIRHSALSAGADAGQSGNWSGPVTVSSESDAQTPDLTNFYADQSGKVWISYTAYSGSYDIYVRSWTPGGGWSSGQQASTGGGTTAHHSRIAVDNAGYVHVIYWQGNGDGIRYAYRDPNTGQFISSVQLPGSGGAIQYTGLAVNRSAGDVHAIYSTGDSDNTRIIKYVKKSGSTGTNFSSPIDLTGTGNHVTLRLAWAQTGRLVMASDKRDANKVVYATSENNGASWNSSTELTDNGVSAFDPGLGLADNGSTFISYWNKSGNTINMVTLFNVPPTPRCAGFSDVAESDATCAAIAALTNSRVINGYSTVPPTFGPNDAVQRAQIAAFLVRGLSWQNKPTGPKSFNDFGPLVDELRTASLILANSCDRAGANCVAQGYNATTFGPNDAVTYAQVLTFISRAFVQDTTYHWPSPPTVSQPYSNVPSVHDQDVRTYHQNAGLITGVPVPTTEAGWNAAAPRAWVAFVLYQALQSTH